MQGTDCDGGRGVGRHCAHVEGRGGGNRSSLFCCRYGTDVPIKLLQPHRDTLKERSRYVLYLANFDSPMHAPANSVIWEAKEEGIYLHESIRAMHKRG